MRFEPPAYAALPTVAAMVRSMNRHVTGLESTKLRLSLILRRFMVAAALGHARPAQNVLLIGPSGSGKTHGLRQLLNAVPVVWGEIDVTSFSDVGYAGRDLASMYLGLLQPQWRGKRGDEVAPWTSQEMVAHAQRWGVVIIDEFDKLRAPARPKEGERQVGRALQAELLKLVEGVEVLCKRNEDDRGVFIQTGNILHIAVGAFQGLNAVVARDLRDLGQSVAQEEHAYEQASVHNIIDYGFLEELVGRFSTVVTLPPLNSGHLAEIFREHVVPDFERQCADDGLELIVEDGAISAAGNRAVGLRIGARALGPMLDDCLAPQWAQAQPGDRLRVTAETMMGGTAILERAVAA